MSTANTARTNASNAQATANRAQNTANTANTNAQAAQTTADTALSTANSKLNQTQVDARVNAIAIPQGEVNEIDVIADADYTALVTKADETMYLVEGDADFTPTQENLYVVAKEIFVPGTNTTLTEDDVTNTIAVNAMSGGSAFTPSKANLYSAVKDILVHSASPAATADDANNEIDVTNVDGTKLNQTQVDARVNAIAVPQGDVVAMDSLTQTEYDAITTKSATTLYIITS